MSEPECTECLLTLGRMTKAKDALEDARLRLRKAADVLQAERRRSSRFEASVTQAASLRARQQTARLKKDVTHWRGRFKDLRVENNALRRDNRRQDARRSLAQLAAEARTFAGIDVGEAPQTFAGHTAAEAPLAIMATRVEQVLSDLLEHKGVDWARYIDQLTSSACENDPEYTGSRWLHPDVSAFSKALEQAEQLMKACRGLVVEEEQAAPG